MPKLMLKERDRVRREMEYLEVTLATLTDDVNRFGSGQTHLDEFNERLEEHLVVFAVRLKELRQCWAIQEEQDFIQTMESSIPNPSV